MHVQFVVVCEQIVIGSDGKPSLIGIFNDVQVPSFPFTLPRLAFGARILFTSGELGRNYRVEVLLKDPQGNEIGRPGGDVSLPPAPPGLEVLAVDVPMQFDLFGLESAGQYTFLLHVDGKATAGVQVAVRQAPPEQQMA